MTELFTLGDIYVSDFIKDLYSHYNLDYKKFVNDYDNILTPFILENVGSINRYVEVIR